VWYFGEDLGCAFDAVQVALFPKCVVLDLVIMGAHLLFFLVTFPTARLAVGSRWDKRLGVLTASSCAILWQIQSLFLHMNQGAEPRQQDWHSATSFIPSPPLLCVPGV
ncbi:hypothetical protein BZG21_36530, partial [Escherichia coli]|nr:hypothetical protein [Escherichia coli]